MRQQGTKSTVKSPKTDKTNGQIDNVKKFWSQMEPIFRFLSEEEVTDILSSDMSHNDKIKIPTFGTSDSEPEEIEKNTKYCFAETKHTREGNHSCPICQQTLQYKSTPDKWSCDDFYHFGLNDFPKNKHAYCCANDDCDIAVCIGCHSRMASSDNQFGSERWCMFRKNSTASRVISAYLHPLSKSWFWAEGNPKVKLDEPTTDVPIYSDDVNPKEIPFHEEEISNHTFEERLRLELQRNDLWDSDTDKLEFQDREDDELCSVLREKHLILTGWLKEASVFKNKILTRCVDYSERSAQTKRLKKAQEEFLRVTQDEKSTSEEIEQAVALFEKTEKEIGMNLASLLKTEWTDQ